MKRGDLLRHLRRHGCHLKREGWAHSLWTNPTTGALEAIPRHAEISNRLAQKICRGLSVPEIGEYHPEKGYRTPFGICAGGRMNPHPPVDEPLAPVRRAAMPRAMGSTAPILRQIRKEIEDA